MSSEPAARVEEEPLAGLFRVLAGPERLRLLGLLAERQLTLEDCAANLAPSSADVPVLVAELVECGWVVLRLVDGVCRYRADPRAVEVMDLASAFARDCSDSLSTCSQTRDETWLGAPGVAGARTRCA